MKSPELGKGEVPEVLIPTRPKQDWAPKCTQDSPSDVTVELNHKKSRTKLRQLAVTVLQYEDWLRRLPTYFEVT